MTGAVSRPSFRPAKYLPCPAMMLPLESIRIGELNPKCAMLPAVCAICASEWRLGFLGDGASSASFLCSILCAIACESILHLPLQLVWRDLPEDALGARLTNKAFITNIRPLSQSCTASNCLCAFF